MTKYVDMLFQDTDFRDFYRLKDELLCEYKVLDPFQIKHSAPDDHFDYSEEIQLLAKVRILHRESSSMLESLDVENSGLINYLENLNHQIGLIGRRVLLNEIREPERFTSRLIDLSVGGAALLHDQPFLNGTMFALRVLFLDGSWVFTCFGEVRFTQHLDGESRYRSGIEFVDLKLEQEKSIQRYLLARQADLRSKRSAAANVAETDLGLVPPHGGA